MRCLAGMLALLLSGCAADPVRVMDAALDAGCRLKSVTYAEQARGRVTRVECYE